jgi:drug/metabolite transporter (DMT)-like permease
VNGAPRSRHRRPALIGAAWVIGSAVAFAAMPIFGKVAYAEGMSPIGLLAWRFTIAAAALWLVVALRRSSLAFPGPGQSSRLLLLGGGVLAGEVALYFFGLQHLSAGLAEVLLFLFPAWVVLLTAVARRSMPGGVVASCTVLAVTGAALAVLGGADSLGQDAPIGVVLLLAASVVYAFYVILSGRAVVGVGALVTTTYVVTGAAATFVLAAVATGAGNPQTQMAWLAVVGIALISTVLAFGLLSAGLSVLPATHASVIATSEPVIAVILAAVLLGESVAIMQAAGVGLVVASIVAIIVRDVAGADADELLERPL